MKKPTKQVSMYNLPYLLAEEKIKSSIPIPKSLHLAIEDFRAAYSERYGCLLSGGVKTIAILMMAHGLEGLKAEADRLREEASIPI